MSVAALRCSLDDTRQSLTLFTNIIGLTRKGILCFEMLKFVECHIRFYWDNILWYISIGTMPSTRVWVPECEWSLLTPCGYFTRAALFTVLHGQVWCYRYNLLYISGQVRNKEKWLNKTLVFHIWSGRSVSGGRARCEPTPAPRRDVPNNKINRPTRVIMVFPPCNNNYIIVESFYELLWACRSFYLAFFVMNAARCAALHFTTAEYFIEYLRRA